MVFNQDFETNVKARNGTSNAGWLDLACDILKKKHQRLFYGSQSAVGPEEEVRTSLLLMSARKTGLQSTDEL